ncbi:DNA methyltransferase [Sorangium sp. So ce367]|uniref:Eco57I restriction-modification methylase domain-containing protein n=1 Tax=Sorangium sp. So ce367 TaxID=3133305 RepID=UPI003F5FBCF7
MATEKELLSFHKGWIGELTAEHVGLVVTAQALVRAQAYFDRNVLAELHQRFLALVPDLAGQTTRKAERAQRNAGDDADPQIADISALFTDLFEWPRDRIAGAHGGPPLPELVVRLDNFGDDRLEPTYALLDTPPADGSPPTPLVLVRVEPPGTDLDRPLSEAGRRWAASSEARFERLLRERDIPIGLLVHTCAIRLVYAPRTETAGHLTFPVRVLTRTAGRDVLGAMVMLLGPGLLMGPQEHRLPAILRESRRYQNEVSSKLADQVLSALQDLLVGFQSARSLAGDRLMARELVEDRPHLYGGLLATILRLVFLLYTEDKGLLPDDPIFTGSYSPTGLYDRLRDDDARFHDTMDQRYGAWAQLVSLFSMIFFGARYKALRLPARLGDLFDPDAYPFLEGRPYLSTRGRFERIDPPSVADGVVFRVLHKLLFLDGERISYRTLDVEQIGSVYEAMMGYTLEQASGPTLLVKPHHAAVDLATLLKKKPEDRLKDLSEVGCKPGAAVAADIKKARTVEALAQALSKSASPHRPGVLPPGSLYLQPTEERRRSGSHYTPRELTEPIVRKTLEPVLAQLPKRYRASDVLTLKVCDPAMGSGAFLVEACRQLGAALEEAWKRYPEDRPVIPPDETEELHAQRLVTQRCLYGVDKNPFAVALAKLSLWLVTLAREHPFTFLDHALREGDSLVGLDREQIASLHWAPGKQAQVPLLRKGIDEALKRAEALREQIHQLADSDDTKEKERLLGDADHAVAAVRRVGDLVVEVFFSETKEKARVNRLDDYAKRLVLDIGKLPEPDLQFKPFHWEIEFPEVFSRNSPGFDAIVGNPPFLGGTMISTNTTDEYFKFITNYFAESGNRMDLAAYFFRRSFDKLRSGACMGLVATKTIAQGDTRAGGLGWICRNGGIIYGARRRLKWPGRAAVTVRAPNKSSFTPLA